MKDTITIILGLAFIFGPIVLDKILRKPVKDESGLPQDPFPASESSDIFDVFLEQDDDALEATNSSPVESSTTCSSPVESSTIFSSPAESSIISSSSPIPNYEQRQKIEKQESVITRNLDRKMKKNANKKIDKRKLIIYSELMKPKFVE